LLTLYPNIDPTRVSVEPMPVGQEFHDLDRTRQGDRLVSCGALIKRKKFDVLIRELARVPKTHLTIFGEGPERSHLESLVDELNLGDRVTLPGNVSREDLNEAFNQASLFVLLSVDEGFGMVLKEAQKAGCPTMALASDGMVDTGLDYPLGDDEDVAKRICEVLAR
jgi:glycosyltransferase involved in cell wall biosynthesis